MPKEIGVIIDFDDVDYSEEETMYLWGRFARLLAEASELPKGGNNAKCNPIPNRKEKIAC